MTILEKRHEEGKIEIIKELIKMGSENDFMVKASKLSKDQIEEIRKEVESKYNTIIEEIVRNGNLSLGFLFFYQA